MGQLSRVISFRVKDQELEEIHNLMAELGVNSYKGLLLELVRVYKDCSQKEDLREFLQKISNQIDKLSEDLKEIKPEPPTSTPNPKPSNPNNWVVISLFILLAVGALLLLTYLFF